MGSRSRASLGSSGQGTKILIAGLTATLAACTASSGTQRVPSATGGGGSGGMSSGAGGDLVVGTGFAGTSGFAGSSGFGGDIAPPPLGFAGSTGSSSCASSGIAGTGGGLFKGPFSPQLPSTVTTSSVAVPPLAGGTLLALSDGNTAVASDPDRDVVYVVDLTNDTVRAKISLNPGDEPGRLAEDAAGRVHVALRKGGAVVTLDPKAGTVSARRDVCVAPRGIVYQASTQLLHVACASGELVSLPAAGGVATRTVTLERDLRDVVVGTGGSLLVSTFRKADVLVVGADGKVAGRLQPGSGRVQSVMGAPQMRTPSVAWRMVSAGDGSGSVVMLHQTGVTDVIDPVAGGYSGAKGCGGIVQAGVSMLSQDESAPPTVATGINNVSLAIDVAVSPDGTMTAIAVPGNALVPGTPTLVESSTTQVTSNPPSACGTFVNMMANQPQGQVVAVSYSGTGAGVLLAQTREPATIWRGDTNTTITLASDSHVDTGHMIFHVNAGGGLACASCHPEGGEDGRVWNFACVGARRTQSIRGGISPTAPFHWDGSENDFSRLMDDVFSGRMSGPMLSTDQKNALEAWVDTIPAMPKTAGLDATAVARGKALFEDPKVACVTCHTGALLTNNATVDVGTGGPLQVPSLRGVAWRGPFMHTGCANTLADRFGASCGGGDKHGVTSTLTTAQIGDLTAYLQSL